MSRLKPALTPAAERNRRYRDKLRGGPPRATNRFWERVQKTETCWLWMGSRTRQGYGMVWFHGQHWRAHRLAWHLVNSGVPAVLDVLHRCDNPACVRPDHLFLGSDAENAADRERKGRGKHDLHVKITPADAALIRRLYRRGSADCGGPALARLFGVHHRTIYNVINGTAWACRA